MRQHLNQRLGVIIASLLGVLVLGLVGWRLALPPEPLYQGRPISYWLKEYAGGPRPSAQEASSKAIRAIGVRAIPFILAARRQGDSHLQNAYRRVWEDRLPSFYQALVPRPKLPLLLSREAGNALTAIGANAIPGLIDQLRDKHEGVRVSCLMALHNLCRQGGDIRGAIPPLIRALEDPSADVRECAAKTLGQMGPEARPAVKDLIDGLRDSGVAMGGIGTLFPGTVQTLEELSGPFGTVRAACAQALGQIGLAAKAAIPVLARLRQDTNADVQINAAVALKLIDPRMTNVVPQLLASLQAIGDAEGRWSYSLETILETRLGTNETVPLLIAGLRSRDPSCREFAAATLRRLALAPEAAAQAGVK